MMAVVPLLQLPVPNWELQTVNGNASNFGPNYISDFEIDPRLELGQRAHAEMRAGSRVHARGIGTDDDGGYTTDVDAPRRVSSLIATEHDRHLQLDDEVNALAFARTPVFKMSYAVDDVEPATRADARSVRGVVAVRAKAAQTLAQRHASSRGISYATLSRPLIPSTVSRSSSLRRLACVLVIGVALFAAIYFAVFAVLFAPIARDAALADAFSDVHVARRAKVVGGGARARTKAHVFAAAQRGQAFRPGQHTKLTPEQTVARLEREAIAAAVHNRLAMPDVETGGDDDVGPVDAVYTWLNASDPQWRRQLATFDSPERNLLGSNRFRDWDELRHSMRSLFHFAPWVRDVYLVVASPSQVPSWLDVHNKRIHVVYHADIFDDPRTQLPTFNSLAIETALHRIPGLSNFFLYLNNDVLFARPTELSAFIRPNRYYAYSDWPLDTIPATSECHFTADTPWETLMPRVARCQFDHAFFWDRAVALKAWSIKIDAWFAHMPHLWERRVLFRVEKRLSGFIHRTRTNRLRDASTDISMHLQYEAFRLMMSTAAVAGERRVIGVPTRLFRERGTGRRKYMFTTFSNVDAPFAFAAAWHCALVRNRPHFFALDDDLRDPSASLVDAFHTHLGALFHMHWGAPAAWEIDATTTLANHTVSPLTPRAAESLASIAAAHPAAHWVQNPCNDPDGLLLGSAGVSVAARASTAFATALAALALWCA